MIDEVMIETDERGFELVLLGDMVESCGRYIGDEKSPGLRLRLPQDAALQLLKAAQEVIGPWAAERDNAYQEWRVSKAAGELAAWERFTWTTPDPDAYDENDPKRPGWSEGVADAADLYRKRDKGE